MKKLIAILMLVLSFFALVSCGEKGEESVTVTLWVGTESTGVYESLLADFGTWYQEKTGNTFNGSFEVIGVDSGACAATYLTDTQAGADLFVIPHDNIGKLLEGSGTIEPIKNTELIEQMETQCPTAFLNVCYLQDGNGSAAEYYAVPAISQALVLYYNKTVFSGKEDKLATWEGILDVAKDNSAFATSFLGTDGYNFSCFLLAQPKSQNAIDAFGAQGTLEIYKNTKQSNCYNWGDDQVAIMKYAQRFIADPNGRNGALTTSDGWATELNTGKAITVIGGSWSLGTVKSALGAENYGVVQLPSFTLTEDDEYGAAKAGMEFWSGTFADCKCFVKKKDSKAAKYLDDILLYLTSDESQKYSYEQKDNLPASKNVDLGNNQLAAAQVASAQHAISQPFGFKAKYNGYYYSTGAPALYEAIVSNTSNNYNTDAKIIKELQHACFIWAKGKDPADDATLSEWVATQESTRK